ncbi:hypothetical protein EIO60_00378|nr:hypothetical protein [Candidatus Pantoea persica]
MTANDHVILLDRERLTGSDTQLLFDQVYVSDHLGHRMLNLNTGVHLNEVELTVFIQELEGACTTLADLDTGVRAALADIATQL